MQCLFKCFKAKIIKYLKGSIRNTGNLNRIYFISYYGRFDLIDIIYRETNEFLDNTRELEFAASRGNLEAVRFLTELGASCSVNAMDMAASKGHLEIVTHLHLNRSEGCDQALVNASKSGHFHLVRYLVENGLGINRIQEAIDSAKGCGHPEIAKYLEDHVQMFEL